MRCAFFSGVKKIGKRGFTLLEVMIAVSILAIGFVSLFGSQSRSLSYATEAIFNTQAPMLASLKLAEIESGIVDSNESSGDFGDDFPGYTWEQTVEDAAFDSVAALAELENPVQKINLVVTRSETKLKYSLVYYVRIRE